MMGSEAKYEVFINSLGNDHNYIFKLVTLNITSVIHHSWHTTAELNFTKFQSIFKNICDLQYWFDVKDLTASLKICLGVGDSNDGAGMGKIFPHCLGYYLFFNQYHKNRSFSGSQTNSLD